MAAYVFTKSQQIVSADDPAIMFPDSIATCTATENQLKILTTLTFTSDQRHMLFLAYSKHVKDSANHTGTEQS